VRLNNFDNDIIESKLDHQEIKSLNISDFTFSFIDRFDQQTCKKIKAFIAGVVIMSTPNAFSKIFGVENRNREKLISRGACISWSPKNLASALVMFSVRWMVKNTNFSFFSAYSDTEAKELGTIYQACNFTYLGKGSGARAKYFDPLNPTLGWYSDRSFRQVSFYKRYANELGISWQKDWNDRNGMRWKNVPVLIEKLLRQKSRECQRRCIKLKISRKHKYLYILGKNKRETKKLKTDFFKLNPKIKSLNYPKIRGE
jgi:hypothetical protein